MTVRLFIIFAGIAAIASSQAPAPLGFAFADVAREAGLTAPTIYGGQRTNKFLLETTGCGVAMLDYDNDGWLDLFFVNGTTLEGFPSGAEPTSHLYRNRGNGTFDDVTVRAGLAIAGWGQAACAGDYDNDGFDDLYVTFWGQNRLFRNRGNGTIRGRHRPRGARHQDPLGRRLRVRGCRPRRPAGSLRRQLHRPRSEDRARAGVRALPVQGDSGGLRSAGPERREERAVPESRAAAPSPTSPRRPASRAPRAHTASASARSTSTMTGGRMCTSRTTRTRAPSIATVAMARSRTLRSRRVARTARTASRRPAWVSRSATTIGTARSTSSRPTSRATRRRCTPIPARASARIARSGAASGSTPDGSGGASDSSTWIMTAGSICSSSTGTCTPKWSRSGPKRDTASARCSIAICATAGSRI